MTTDLIPFSFDAREIRLIDRSGEIWFVATDVAEVLGYRNAPDMTRNLDDDEKGTQIMRTPGGDQELSIISESGLYAAILKSRKPEAKRFRKWVTSEVLPAIRQTGHYVLPATITPAQQSALQQIVARRAGEDGKIRAYVWSRFNNHFHLGSYKQLPAAQFEEAVAYLDAMPLKDEKAEPLKALPLDVNYPLESARPPEGCNGLGFYAFAQADGWVDPNWELLMKLKAAGYNVDGPIYSHQAKIHVMTALYNGLIGKAVENMNVACTSLAYAPIYLR